MYVLTFSFDIQCWALLGVNAMVNVLSVFFFDVLQQEAIIKGDPYLTGEGLKYT